MAGVSAETWKVTFDSKLTADQRAAAIKKLKDDGAKWYNANCGKNATDLDDESELSPRKSSAKCKAAHNKAMAFAKRVQTSKKLTAAQKKKIFAKMMAKMKKWGKKNKCGWKW